MNVTLVLPTRERYEMFEKCISSFLDKAMWRDKVEVICMVDYDDAYMYEVIANFALHNPADNIYIVTRHRALTTFVKSYTGLVYPMATGKFFFPIQDENVMVTDKWDQILVEQAETFLADKPDRLLYTIIDDDTHTPQGGSLSSYTLESGGCCFPIVSKETVMAQKGFFPEEINFWGSDIAEWRIFTSLVESRILNLSNLIRIEHNSEWHKNHVADSITESVIKHNSMGRTSLAFPEHKKYVDRLNEEILRHKNG